MFVVIYRWRVLPGREQEFVQAWTRLTEIVFETAGSRGSRLHRGEDGTFLAYAQWPSRISWEELTIADGEMSRCRRIMEECAVKLTPDLCLEVIADRLAM